MRLTFTFVEVKSKRAFFWQKIFASFYYGLFGYIGGMVLGSMLLILLVPKLLPAASPSLVMIVSGSIGIVLAWIAVWRGWTFIPPEGKTLAEAIAELPDR